MTEIELSALIDKARLSGSEEDLARLHQDYWDLGFSDREDTAIFMLRKASSFEEVLGIYRDFPKREGVFKDSCLDYFAEKDFTELEIDRLTWMGYIELQNFKAIEREPIRSLMYRLFATVNSLGKVSWHRPKGYLRREWYIKWSKATRKSITISIRTIAAGETRPLTRIICQVIESKGSLYFYVADRENLHLMPEKQVIVHEWLVRILNASSPRQYTVEEISRIITNLETFVP